jgi:glycerophosphoryl diester phosphodiesterase
MYNNTEHSLEIITHRGLEPEKKEFFTESTYEAFADQAKRGFGLEFDANFTADDQVVIFHDAGLERITKGQDKRLFSEMSLAETKEVKLDNGRLCDLDELFGLIESGEAKTSALHLKGKFQAPKYLDILVNHLKKHPEAVKKILIFDAKVETAKYLKEQIPEIQLAPSVAHEYDVERYNSAVGGTLIPTNEALDYPDLFTWVWLDEWDRSDKNGGEKSLYNQEVFQKLRDQGIKIALVTPELHATSPNLLGGESHPDAASQEKLASRLREIIALKPDLICTDYPLLAQEIEKNRIDVILL